MKIKIIKSFRPSPHSDHLNVGDELEARVLPGALLNFCQPYQIIDGKHSGQEVPVTHCIKLPEEKTHSEQQFTDLKQENIQRLEEVKGLQRQVSSLIESANIKQRKHEHLSREYAEILGRLQKAHEDKDAALASLERAMLDHQPVVLPKEVADEMVKWRNNGYSNFEIIELIRANHCTNNPRHLELSPMSVWADRHQNPFMRALSDGYTVELELPIAEQLADMIHEWTNEPAIEDEATECLALATRIAERTKEFYSK